MTALDLGPILSAAGWMPCEFHGISGWLRYITDENAPEHARRRTQFVDVVGDKARIWGGGLGDYVSDATVPVERVPEFLRERGAL